MTERKSLALTGRRAALPEIAPESVANVRRTRMQIGVAKVLGLSAQFSAFCRPHKKDCCELKKGALGKKLGAIRAIGTATQACLFR